MYVDEFSSIFYYYFVVWFLAIFMRPSISRSTVVHLRFPSTPPNQRTRSATLTSFHSKTPSKPTAVSVTGGSGAATWSDVGVGGGKGERVDKRHWGATGNGYHLNSNHSKASWSVWDLCQSSSVIFSPPPTLATITTDRPNGTCSYIHIIPSSFMLEIHRPPLASQPVFPQTSCKLRTNNCPYQS